MSEAPLYLADEEEEGGLEGQTECEEDLLKSVTVRVTATSRLR